MRQGASEKIDAGVPGIPSTMAVRLTAVLDPLERWLHEH